MTFPARKLGRFLRAMEDPEGTGTIDPVREREIAHVERCIAHRVAVIVAPLTADRDYSALDLGMPVAGAPMCVVCLEPAALVLDAGPACRRCLNDLLNHRMHPEVLQ